MSGLIWVQTQIAKGISKLKKSPLAGKELSASKAFGLLLYVPGNSYGHVGTVSSPNHTFFPGKLEQAVNQYLYTYFRL